MPDRNDHSCRGQELDFAVLPPLVDVRHVPAMTTTTRYLLIDEAAAIARTSPNTIRYWIQIGRLRSTRPGRRRLIAERDLIALIEAPNGGGGPRAR